MSRIASLLVGVLLATLYPVGASGEQTSHDSEQTEAARISAERRHWLYQQLVAKMKSPRAKRQIATMLRHVPQEQVEQLVELYRDPASSSESAGALSDDERTRNVLKQLRAASRRTARNRPAGFFPVITWLPEGTQFQARGVITPDGRFVRVDAFPFFSSIGNVDTFNLYTGQVRPIRRRPPPRPQVWYDGLRTRYEVRPRRSTSDRRVWHDGLRTRSDRRPSR